VPSATFLCGGMKFACTPPSKAYPANWCGLGTLSVQRKPAAVWRAWRSDRLGTCISFVLAHSAPHAKMPLFSQSVSSNCEPSVIYIGDRRDDSVACGMRVDRQWNRWGSPGAGRGAPRPTIRPSRARPSLDGSAPACCVLPSCQNCSTSWGRLPRAGLSRCRISIASGSTRYECLCGSCPEGAAIILTEGLLRGMTRGEIAGILAHEVAHIRNNDAWTMNWAMRCIARSNGRR